MIDSPLSLGSFHAKLLESTRTFVGLAGTPAIKQSLQHGVVVMQLTLSRDSFSKDGFRLGFKNSSISSYRHVFSSNSRGICCIRKEASECMETYSIN